MTTQQPGSDMTHDFTDKSLGITYSPRILENLTFDGAS